MLQGLSIGAADVGMETPGHYLLLIGQEAQRPAQGDEGVNAAQRPRGSEAFLPRLSLALG